MNATDDDFDTELDTYINELEQEIIEILNTKLSTPKEELK